MKQIRTIFTTVCLLLLLSVPMTAWAAPEPEPVTSTESMEGRATDAGKETIKQEAEKEEAKNQSSQGDSGIIQIQNAAAGTGERLSGAVFAVCERNGRKRGELTLQDGATSLSLPAGDYYLRQLKAPSGYGVEPARIVFAISKGETTLAEITSEIDLKNVNPQDIIPKTGQDSSVLAYAFSALCFTATFLCGFKLRQMDGGNRRKGGVRSWQS